MTFVQEKYKRLVELAVAQLAGGYVSFEGDEFCEDCKGWDGVSRRCDCGNRRVEWELSDDETYIYPQVW